MTTPATLFAPAARRTGLALLLGSALGLPLLAGAQVVTYKYVVTDLGTLGGSSANANGINSAGQVVGSSKTAGDAITRAFRTAANRAIVVASDDLGTLGGANSFGNSINASGQVAGSADTASAGPFASVVRRAFRADPGAPMIDLGTLAPLGGANGFNNSGANALNDGANVVGFATVPEGCASSSHAFRTYPNQLISASLGNLGTLAPLNCRSSTAYGVNSLSMVVGDSATTFATGFPNHAFRWTVAGGMIDLGTLGGRDSTAYAVNDRGEIVGGSKLPQDLVNNPFDSPHAFLAAGAFMVDIGTLGGSYSTAYAINSRDPLDSQIVGDASTTGDAALHGFLYTGNVFNGGSMVDLNSRIAAGSGWEIVAARGLNDKGQIVGSAWRGGVRFVAHAVRLDPSDVAVNVLVASLGDASLGLTSGQIASFTDKLQSAYNSIRAGLNKQATNQLNALVNAVDTAPRKGKLSASAAATLTAAANAIIAVL